MESTFFDSPSYELYRLGREAMKRRKFDLAVALFRASVELCPHFKTLELLGECLLEPPQRLREATVFLAAAAGLGNKASRAFFLLARALSLQGDIQAAIEKLDIAIQMQPDFKAAIQLRDDLRNRLPLLPERKVDSQDEPEYAMCCPQCHSREVVFQGLETSAETGSTSGEKYNWTCDACGHQWKDDGIEEKV